VIYLSDGGKWCRTVAETHFPGATLILDVFHLAKHVIETANALLKPGGKNNEDWRRSVLRGLLEGEYETVVESLRTVTYTLKSKREAIRKFLGYLEANKDRRNYTAYVEAHDPIGSGPIEAACRHVIGDRMKGAGRRWDDDGADAMARLRAVLCSGEWDETLEMLTQSRFSPGPLLRQVA
jgi:hypothetical protein